MRFKVQTLTQTDKHIKKNRTSTKQSNFNNPIKSHSERKPDKAHLNSHISRKNHRHEHNRARSQRTYTQISARTPANSGYSALNYTAGRRLWGWFERVGFSPTFGEYLGDIFAFTSGGRSLRATPTPFHRSVEIFRRKANETFPSVFIQNYGDSSVCVCVVRFNSAEKCFWLVKRRISFPFMLIVYEDQYTIFFNYIRERFF